MFTPHPSTKLNNLFVKKPYQGVNPFIAKFLFIGLDANYSESIESSDVFEEICEYHMDSVSFWKKYNVHHPFLLPNYNGDGRLYHRNFAKIGFSACMADQISFVELLDVPTVGRNKLRPSDLNDIHLELLNDAILNGTKKHVFISASVLLLMKASKKFPWVNSTSKPSELLPLIYSKNENRVYKHLHFSNYGKFQQRLASEAAAISLLSKV